MSHVESPSEHTLNNHLAVSLRSYMTALDDDTPFSTLIPTRSYKPKKPVPEALEPWFNKFYRSLTPDEKGQMSRLLSLFASIQPQAQDDSPRDLPDRWRPPVSNTLGTFRAMTIDDFMNDYKVPEHHAGEATYDFLANAGFFREE